MSMIVPGPCGENRTTYKARKRVENEEHVRVMCVDDWQLQDKATRIPM